MHVRLVTIIFLASSSFTGSGLVRAEERMAGFAVSSGGEAAKPAAEALQILRAEIAAAGTYEVVDVRGVLEPKPDAARVAAINAAAELLKQGKNDYEQLDLEKSQEKFRQAMKKLEVGYGYLQQPELVLECLLYLGATWVLAGEPEKAIGLFKRTAELPGSKVLDPNLFPPNIQEILEQALKVSAGAPKGAVRLVTEPPGAEIYVDETFSGISPVLIKNLRIGEHFVRAMKDGYKPWGGKIKVKAGAARSLKMQMKATKRNKTFVEICGKVAAEIQKGTVADSTSRFMKMFRADAAAFLVLEGTARSMTHHGFRIEGTQLASELVVLDTTQGSYPGKLREFARQLLTAKPGSPAVAAAVVAEPAAGTSGGDAKEGEAAAAALLTKTGETEEEEETTVGVNDHPTDNEGSPDSGKTTRVASATPTEEKPAPTEEKPAPTVEKPAPSADATVTKSLQDTRKPEEKEESSSWYSQWWFWTVIGVVAAGAAVGTYFLVSSGGPEGGGLIIDMH